MSRLQNIMKAVRIRQFGGPEVCKVESISIPEPSANQVLIKVKYAGVNPVDTYIRSGNFASKPTLPYTPGSDCAGVIHAVGAGVKDFKKGDAVFTFGSVTGSSAEYCISEVNSVYPLNTSRLTFQQGAGLGVPYFTSYRALKFLGQAKAGQSVLIHGASGGVGTVAVQLAKALGLQVYATAGSDRGLQLIKECGADFIYNHREPDYMSKIKAQTKGKGVNLILEMLANVNLQPDLELLCNKQGRVVVIGSRGTTQVDPVVMLMKETIILGCTLYATEPEEWLEMRKAIAQHQQQSWLSPVVGAEYPLEDTSKAHADIINSKSAYGNIVIRV